MHLKSFVSAVIVFVALCLPASAQPYDLNKFLGTYLSYTYESPDLIGVKRLTMSKGDDGKVKVRAALAGFPDDVNLGEATPECYTMRTANNAKSYVANFSAGKLSVLMVINASARMPETVHLTAYMKYTDGSKPSVYFVDEVRKEPEKPAK